MRRYAGTGFARLGRTLPFPRLEPGGDLAG
jgi:hypothetical protein